MISVFWQHGYDASSVVMLTEACGLGAPSLYNAFGDKRTLFLEALDRYLMTYAAFTSSALEEEQAYTAIARLLREAAAAYTRPDKPAGCLLITATTNCGPQSSDVADRLRARRTEGRRALTAKLQTALDAGELPPDTDPSALAGFYAATLQGMSAQARDGASKDDLLKIAAAALRAWPGTHVA
jgi:AcrR family transcriptional regulator